MRRLVACRTSFSSAWRRCGTTSSRWRLAAGDERLLDGVAAGDQLLVLAEQTGGRRLLPRGAAAARASADAGRKGGRTGGRSKGGRNSSPGRGPSGVRPCRVRPCRRAGRAVRDRRRYGAECGGPERPRYGGPAGCCRGAAHGGGSCGMSLGGGAPKPKPLRLGPPGLGPVGLGPPGRGRRAWGPLTTTLSTAGRRDAGARDEARRRATRRAWAGRPAARRTGRPPDGAASRLASSRLVSRPPGTASRRVSNWARTILAARARRPAWDQAGSPSVRACLPASSRACARAWGLRRRLRACVDGRARGPFTLRAPQTGAPLRNEISRRGASAGRRGCLPQVSRVRPEPPAADRILPTAWRLGRPLAAPAGRPVRAATPPRPGA